MFGADLTNQERKALKMEVQRMMVQLDKKYADDLDASILWYLHVAYGFDADDLRKFWEGFAPKHKELVNYYEMEDADADWICTLKLKDIGVDIAAWNAERGD